MAAVLAMRVPGGQPVEHAGVSAIEQFTEGWSYTYTSTPIRSIIALIALVCLLGVPYSVLMPIFAATILGGGPHTLGFLMTASGGSALLGALWLASRSEIHGLSRAVPLSAPVFVLVLVSFAFSC